jgi:acetyl-CoA decarbonylase/synthase complex subunit delta
MAIPELAEKWTNEICTVKIGATADEGGTRSKAITVGGQKSLPFMHFEAPRPNAPILAMEVQDRVPEEWPDMVKEPYANVMASPGQWAAKCVNEYGADMIALKLQGTHPDFGDASPDAAASAVKEVLEAVDVPLIIWGSDDDAKDNEVLPVCAQATSGEMCLFGSAKEDNYKTLVAACLADGHALVTESPIDINIAKQVNVLVSEMGFPLDRVVMYHTTGALGYGIEYVYSIMERARLAALSGDKMMAMPVICLIGQEAWRAKEARASDEEAPEWGQASERGPLWETITATTFLQAGADILVMRHPRALSAVRKVADALMSQ